MTAKDYRPNGCPACHQGTWRLMTDPPSDDRDVLVCTSEDTYLIRYCWDTPIGREWAPGAHDPKALKHQRWTDLPKSWTGLRGVDEVTTTRAHGLSDAQTVWDQENEP